MHDIILCFFSLGLSPDWCLEHSSFGSQNLSECLQMSIMECSTSGMLQMDSQHWKLSHFCKNAHTYPHTPIFTAYLYHSFSNILPSFFVLLSSISKKRGDNSRETETGKILPPKSCSRQKGDMCEVIRTGES